MGKYVSVCEVCGDAWAHEGENALEYCPRCSERVRASGYTEEQWDTMTAVEKFHIKEKIMTNPARIKELEHQLRSKLMIITTTPSVEGYTITQYLEVISGEVVVPNGLLGMLTVGTFFTSSALKKARSTAFDLLKDAALELEADAVIGVDVDINELHGTGVMVSVNGTAVKLRKPN